MQTALQQSFWDRFSGVVALQRQAYESIPRDPQATGQGWLIVLLLGLGNGIGVIVTGAAGLPPEIAADMPELNRFLAFETTGDKFVAIMVGVAGALLSWYLSAWLLRVVGTRLTRPAGRSIAPDEMRRLVAWGYAPSLASFLAPIPLVGPFLALFGAFWTIVTGIMAVRVAFNVGIGKAIAIEVVAFLAIVVLVVVLVTIAVLATLVFGS
jgi:hypothetical protein